MKNLSKNSDAQASEFYEAGIIHHAISDLETVQVSEIIPENQDRILKLSNQIARSRLAQGEAITSPERSREAIRNLMESKQEEVMAVMFLDAKHRIISFEELFHGTIDSAMVYARVLVKRVLAHNSSAIILAHNHPSGVCEPSRADEALTQRVNEVMSLIEVRLLDHFVVGAEGMYSFAENGKI